METRMKLIVLLLSWGTVTADNSVLLKANLQKVTSSTLKWVTASSDTILRDAVIGSVEYLPIGASEIRDSSRMNITDPSQLKEIKIHICRTRINGNWIPGTLNYQSRVCIVSLLQKVYQKDQYEVLQNVDQAARLVWKDWSWNIDIPQKAVSAGDYFIAHAVSRNLTVYSEKVAIGRTHWIGKIDPREGVFGKMSVVNERNEVMNDIEKGQVLTEIEPDQYELTITKLTTAREKVICRTVLKLGEVTLRNDLQSPMKVESVITYQWQYNSSWSPVKAMLRGLSTRIFFPNNSEDESIKWGIQKEEIRDGIQSVDADLEAGTAVQVVLQANLFEVEVPYTGSLLSVFEDSHTMNRTVQGNWLRTALVDIEPVFGPIYYLHNNSLVPTTTTTTTTRTTTTENTSTTTATTTTGASLEAEGTAVHDITSQNKNDSSTLPVRDDNVMSDGSDALLLKKKNEPDKEGSGSIAFISYLCFVCSLLFTTIIRCMSFT